MKKIIFLDIDGVLNNDKSVDYYGGYGGHFEEQHTPTEQLVRWDQVAVDNLKYIVEQTGAEIVVSSTWRRYFSVDKFKQMFAVYGWNDAPIIDKTIQKFMKDSLIERGFEVNIYLSENTIDSYVIIDDLNMFLTEQQNSFVNTYGLDGLTYEDAQKAVQILNKVVL